MSDSSGVMEERAVKDKKRDQAGFKGEVSGADQTSIDNNQKDFVLKSFTGYKAAESTSARRRRRRSTSKSQLIILIYLHCV